MIRNLLFDTINAVRFLGRPVSIGSGTRIPFSTRIRLNGGGRVIIGRNCEIHSQVLIATYGGEIRIGDNSSINPFSVLYGHGGLTIGAGVRIAAQNLIIPANHQPGDDEIALREKSLSADGIEIGADTWLGAGCKILDGVRLGKHVIVGAGSVVTKSFPDYAKIAGVPAKLMNVLSE